jgi:hypothetical protein
MARSTTHPHAEAIYRVVPLSKEGVFGVEVVIPDRYPTTVTEFTTEAEAEAWIAQHKSVVEANVASGSSFRKRRGATG